jgi:hypothetical protein
VSLDDLGDLAATDLAAAASPAGRSWLAAMPAMVAELARQWHFTADDDVVRHGYHAVVVDGRALALKPVAVPAARGAAAADPLDDGVPVAGHEPDLVTHPGGAGRRCRSDGGVLLDGACAGGRAVAANPRGWSRGGKSGGRSRSTCPTFCGG